MKYVRKVLATTMVVSVMLTGGAFAQTAAQCKKKCNDTYAACQKSRKDENKCLAEWVACKKKCDAPAARRK